MKSEPQTVVSENLSQPMEAVCWCHVPFGPEVKAIPGVEWLIIKGGKNKGNSPKFENFPDIYEINRSTSKIFELKGNCCAVAPK